MKQAVILSIYKCYMQIKDYRKRDNLNGNNKNCKFSLILMTSKVTTFPFEILENAHI